MIEGGNPRHICIDLTHFTSQSKIFDTAGFLQSACQVLLMVSKIRTPEAIGTSMRRVGGMTALSCLVQHFIYPVNILLASKFLSSIQRSNIHANFRNKKAR
jgi:hypothetical protein